MKLPVTIKDQTIEVDIPEEKLIAAGWKKPVSKRRWKPRHMDLFYYVNSHWVNNAVFDKDNAVVKAILRSCIVYKTVEEAKKALERQKSIIRVNDRIDELNEGWEPDFGRDNMERNHYIESDSYGQFCTNWDRSSTRPMAINYCKSNVVAEQIIRECEADLKVIFEV